MKKAFLLLVITLTIISCKKDNISHQDEFDQSHKAWVSFKQSSNNSYTYVVNWGSWTGYGSETVLRISGGVVVNRQFTSHRLVYPQGGGTPTEEMLTNWTETANMINTHDRNEGAADAVTLDEIYEKAKNIWLKADKKENDVYFEANNGGMISNCGFVSKGCQDDCFNGISITSIKAQ